LPRKMSAAFIRNFPSCERVILLLFMRQEVPSVFRIVERETECYAPSVKERLSVHLTTRPRWKSNPQRSYRNE
jgi:hypothetical protein